jgi:copper homeostasis protein
MDRWSGGMSVLLEICVDSLASLEAAVAGGADRIELCAALELGGLTPSPAFLAKAVATGLPIHAMIRPRAGGFVYDEAETALMIEDIRRFVSGGAAGVVVGALRHDHRLDSDTLAQMRDAAGDAVAVLHRAIDLTPDPVAAAEEALAIGFDKVLSSGGTPTAVEGQEVLAQMVAAAGEGLSIIAGSGVRADNVARLIAGTDVREVHASASEPVPEADPRVVAMGFAAGARRLTRAPLVAQLRAAIDAVTK